MKVWESWDKFEGFINNMNEKEIQGLKEFKEFYQKCKENDFNYIEYTFKRKYQNHPDGYTFSRKLLWLAFYFAIYILPVYH